MSQLEFALSKVGVDISGIDPSVGAALSLGAAVQQFTSQNLTPAEVSSAAQLLAGSLATLSPVAGAVNPLQNSPAGGGEWESLHYADDLVRHQPKFKFLFKVKFEGFGVENFYRYVHRIDRPRVQLNHTEVNYYNFRTRVLTSVLFQPITCTFLDEIENSVSDFFVAYLAKTSGTASGGWGIDKGFGAASSTKPYANGYSAGKKIIVEQVFANGVLSQRYSFINPRIESFDYDELNMEDNGGSMLTATFSYDALQCETVSRNTLYTWGETDLLRGGGTSGLPAGGVSSVYEDGLIAPTSAGGGAIDGGVNPRTPQPNLAYELLQGGVDASANIPPSLADLVNVQSSLNATVGAFTSSTLDTVSINAAQTLSAIRSGANLQFPVADNLIVPSPDTSGGPPIFVGLDPNP